MKKISLVLLIVLVMSLALTQVAGFSEEDSLQAAFTYTRPQTGGIKVGEKVGFDAGPSYNPNGIINEYLWEFWHDGKLIATKKGMKVFFNFPYIGIWKVKLTAGIWGKDDSISENIMVKGKENVEPSPHFNYVPSKVNVGDEVTFDASLSSDLDGYIIEYGWDLNEDGKIDIHGDEVSWTFHKPGVYPVALTVKDDSGGRASARRNIEVNQPPIADFSYTQAIVGQVARFTSESEDSDGRIVECSWDFDGDEIDAYGKKVEWVFDSPGLHHITLEVTDNKGASEVRIKTIRVKQAPEADFNYTPKNLLVYQMVKFDASSSKDGDGSIVEYAWDLNNDGITDAYGHIANYRFPSPGHHLISLTVTDEDGLSHSIKKEVEVSGHPSQIKTGVWIRILDEKVLVAVKGDSCCFSQGYKIMLKIPKTEDGRFVSISKEGELYPPFSKKRLQFTGKVRMGWKKYIITVEDATQVKFKVLFDEDSNGFLEEWNNIIYVGDELRHPPSNPFLLKLPSGELKGISFFDLLASLLWK